MKPAEIKTLLESMGASAKKSLGQHFLIDKHVLADIVGSAEVRKGESVLEIGPGLGVLTDELLERGAHVVAIEKDKKFAGRLEELNQENLTIIQGDAAKLDWDTLVPKKWKLVANLPYAITSLALRKALTAKNAPEKIVVLIQKEVADRILARDRKHSLLSLMVALNSKSVRLVRKVGKGAFYPPPKVESAVLEIVPLPEKERNTKWGTDPEEIMRVAKVGFAHPRKKLQSNIKSFVKDTGVFQRIGLKPDVRAEDLAPEDWARLVSML